MLSFHRFMIHVHINIQTTKNLKRTRTFHASLASYQKYTNMNVNLFSLAIDLRHSAAWIKKQSTWYSLHNRLNTKYYNFCVDNATPSILCSVFVTKNLGLLMLWYAFCYSINIIHILKVVLYLPILNYVLSFNIVILNGIPLDDIGKFENLLKTSLKMKEVGIEQ